MNYAERAEAAVRLLTDPLYSLVMETLRETASEGLFQSAPGDKERREDLYQFRRALDAFDAQLNVYVQEAAHYREASKEQD